MIPCPRHPYPVGAVARPGGTRRRTFRAGTWLLILVLGWALQCAGGTAFGAADPAPPKSPLPWRLGYVETKPFINYAATLANLVYALADMGLISTVADLPYTPEQVDTRVLWDFLASRDLGPRITFVADAYYSFGDLKGAQFGAATAPIVDRLRDKRDIDLLIVMGTDAGKALAAGDHRTPTLVFSTSNAVKAGIIAAVEDSGKDHVWAHMDPQRYRRQLEIFHDIFAFERLGIAYEDTPGGRTFAALEDVEAVARERGFTIVRERVQQPSPGRMEEFYAELAAANQRLAKQVDATYFGLFIGIDPRRLPEVLAPFIARGIPVFAQQAPDDVRHGALMSVARADFKGIGRFGAETIRKVMQGTKPRDLEQVFENSPNIILNLAVARAIGYQPRFEILLVADEVFQELAGQGHEE